MMTMEDDDETRKDPEENEGGDNNNNMTTSHHSNNNIAGATEAGIVRGVSRSVAQRGARSMAKLPAVGKLPRTTVKPPRGAVHVPKHVVARTTPKGNAIRSATRRRVPVRRVAKVTDRMSTGLDLWESGTEAATEPMETAKNQAARWDRAKAFVKSLAKNTFLGTVVFETYCWIVTNSNNYFEMMLFSSGTKSRKKKNEQEVLPKEDPHDKRIAIFYKDVFETTPVGVHYVAGAVAGSLQGLVGTAWDSVALASRRTLLSALPANTVTTTTTPLLRSMSQLAAAHSILFGSYESWKRLFLWSMGNFDNHDNDDDEQSSSWKKSLPQQRLEYFLGVTGAGGLAGQLQHISSHMLEQPTGGARSWTLPSLRSTLWAFPPSAIAFLAFEYGKDMVSEMSTEEEDE
jgi:hypothetical protein